MNCGYIQFKDMLPENSEYGGAEVNMYMRIYIVHAQKPFSKVIDSWYIYIVINIGNKIPIVYKL